MGSLFLAPKSAICPPKSVTFITGATKDINLLFEGWITLLIGIQWKWKCELNEQHYLLDSGLFGRLHYPPYKTIQAKRFDLYIPISLSVSLISYFMHMHIPSLENGFEQHVITHLL